MHLGLLMLSHSFYVFYSGSFSPIMAPFGWAFQSAFVFAKAKSQPKGPKVTATFAQKQLLL